MTKKIRIGCEEVTDGGDIDLDAEEVHLDDGTRLTEDGAKAFAGEVLRSRERGRPSLTAPGERSAATAQRSHRAAPAAKDSRRRRAP